MKYKKIEKLLEESHSDVVKKLNEFFEALIEDTNGDAQDGVDVSFDIMDETFFDENNIPVPITVEMIESCMAEIEDFEAFLKGGMKEVNKLYE